MDKNELANAINNSPLFDMDKDTQNYGRERLKFLNLLAEYYKKIYTKEKFQEACGIIIVKADECLKSYTKGKGPFLHYLNRTLKRELTKQKQADLFVGLKISSKEVQCMRKITRYVKSKNLDLDDKNVQEQLAKVLKLDEIEIVRVLQIYTRDVIARNFIQSKDGEVLDLFDVLPDERQNIEASIMTNESKEELLALIDSTYKNLKERPKKVVSLWLTNELYKILDNIEKIQQYAFLDKKIVTECMQNKKAYTQKELAAICGKAESHVSRTIKNFKNQLKNSGRQI